jgi:crotonobetainyl-CoA:carnitine CoA-transferase CaiB-like acyl-CoA transferase
MALPLAGLTARVDAPAEVGDAVMDLLARLGAHAAGADDTPTLGALEDAGWPGSAAAWAASGAMALTGRAGGAPLLPEAPLAPRLRAAQLVLGLLSSRLGRHVDVDVLGLLGERAALASLGRQGDTSTGGAARLLRAREGWVVVNLARLSDVDSIPAWLECGIPGTDPWETVAAAVADRDAADIVERAQLLGIAVADVPEAGAKADDPQLAARGQRGYGAPWVNDPHVDSERPPSPARMRTAPLVVDLSPLWAGPLCAHLLGLAGGRVVKVESRSRPDAMRDGNPAFFDLLHAGYESVVLDLSEREGRHVLRELILRADVVIEESRPRALAQLGIDLHEVMSTRPQITWISITGYGRVGPWSNRVAFGDDAAAAAGVVVEEAPGQPVFCADAVADPVTGVYAAIGALAALLGGGGHVIDVPLREAAGYACGGIMRPGATPAERLGGDWVLDTGVEAVRVRAPYARDPRGKARPCGADTTAVLAEMQLA